MTIFKETFFPCSRKQTVSEITTSYLLEEVVLPILLYFGAAEPRGLLVGAEKYFLY